MQLSIPQKVRGILLGDARHLQIIFLSTFLLFGLSFLDWQPDLDRYLVNVVVCLTTQAAFLALFNRPWLDLKSAAITSLSLSLLMQTQELYVAAIASILAIGSKFLLRYRGKHVFNPANFGIIVTILLTRNAWINTGQWGHSYLLVILLGICGLLVLNRVGRLDTGLVFLMVYSGLEFGKLVLYQGWEMDVYLHTLNSGTLWLFAFFMITDPVSTPNSPKARVIWAALIGLLSFGFTEVFYLYAAPIWALFCVSPFTAWFDRKFIYKPFKWNSNEKIVSLN